MRLGLVLPLAALHTDVDAQDHRAYHVDDGHQAVVQHLERQAVDLLARLALVPLHAAPARLLLACLARHRLRLALLARALLAAESGGAASLLDPGDHPGHALALRFQHAHAGQHEERRQQQHQREVGHEERDVVVLGHAEAANAVYHVALDATHGQQNDAENERHRHGARRVDEVVAVRQVEHVHGGLVPPQVRLVERADQLEPGVRHGNEISRRHRHKEVGGDGAEGAERVALGRFVQENRAVVVAEQRLPIIVRR